MSQRHRVITPLPRRLFADRSRERVAAELTLDSDPEPRKPAGMVLPTLACCLLVALLLAALYTPPPAARAEERGPPC